MKAKLDISGREQFDKFKPIIFILLHIFSTLPRGGNKLLLRMFRGLGGKVGIVVRYILIKNLAEECGDNVVVKENVYLFGVEKLSLGSNVSIHPMCYLECAGGVRIGDNVSIAHATSVMSTSHTYDDLSIPIKYNPGVHREVIIDDDVWIGCGARILYGVHIMPHSIIGAGAVVNRDTEQYAIYAGVPARKVKCINVNI